MKLLVKRYKKDNEYYPEGVFCVENIARYTERDNNPVPLEKVLETVEQHNQTDSTFTYHIIDIDDNDTMMCEILDFLLGERKYKRHHTIEDLCESLDDLKNELESMVTDINDALYPVESLVEKSKDIIEEIEKEI